MTTVQEARKSHQSQYVNAYIYRRLTPTSWESTPVDVSIYVIEDKLQSINYALDPYAFDVGLFFSSKFTVTLDNSRGKFSSITDSRSIWAGMDTRDNSIFQIECGYINEDGEEVPNVAFEGFLKSSTMEEDGSLDNISFDVYGFENLLNDVYVPSGGLSAGYVSDIIYAMLNVPEVTGILNVDLANIIPYNDFYIDNPSALTNKPIKESLSLVLIASNSVAYVDNDRYFRCSSREESMGVAVQLTSNSQRGLTDNIQRISRFSGEGRIFNSFKSEDGAYVSLSSSENIKKWGIRTKEITLDFVTDPDIIQAILDGLVIQFQYPKEEYEVVTDYLGDAIQLLDKVYLEVFPDFIDTGGELPVCGIAICGEAVCSGYEGGMVVVGDKVFKVLKITHDIKSMSTTLYIRNVGVNLSDGYVGATGTPAVCGFAICGVGMLVAA